MIASFCIGAAILALLGFLFVIVSSCQLSSAISQAEEEQEE